MWYALTYFSNNCSSMTGLLYGEDISSIAKQLIEQCDDNLREAVEDEGLDYEGIAEEYAADLDDYLNLLDLPDPQADDLARFTFTFSDASISVIAIVHTLSELAAAFDQYAADSLFLDEWRMSIGDNEQAVDPQEIDADMRRLCSGEVFTPLYFKSQK